jgi:hypothetical protein
MAAKRKAKKPGREPETLKIEGSWRDAVAHALGRGKPKEEPKKKPKKRK